MRKSSSAEVCVGVGGRSYMQAEHACSVWEGRRALRRVTGSRCVRRAPLCITAICWRIMDEGLSAAFFCPLWILMEIKTRREAGSAKTSHSPTFILFLQMRRDERGCTHSWYQNHPNARWQKKYDRLGLWRPFCPQVLSVWSYFPFARSSDRRY